jgi:CRP/FNR family nitrogen fixation transcriptional regulator
MEPSMQTLSGIRIRKNPLLAEAAEADGVFANSVASMSVPMLYARNTEIYGEGEQADYVYQVVSGAVRTYKVLNDGRRQIGSFYLPGDVFGLVIGEQHELSAEAIVNSTVSVINRRALTGLASRDGKIAHELWALTARELRRAQKHVLLLVRTAQERVASFLLEMADRTSDSSLVELPMSRQDIADYLGLTIETVSRTLTLLEGQAAIALPSARCVHLKNEKQLRKLDS